MKRRHLMLITSLAVMVAVVALAQQKPASLLAIQWAGKAKADAPPVAVLVEFGVKDAKPGPWSGAATITGARVIDREGYCFRSGDELVDPDGWHASSHRPIALPPRNPALNAIEGVSTVGVVYHLSDVKPEAVLKLTVPDQEIKDLEVPLKDVLDGKPTPVAQGRVLVRPITSTTALTKDAAENDFPAAAYGPDGTLWVAYIAYHLKDQNRRVQAANLKEQPKDFRAFRTPEFGDQLFVKYRRDGKWSEPIAVTGAAEDLVRCAITVGTDGTVWLSYSANARGVDHLYVRALRRQADKPDAAPTVGAEEQLTKEPAPQITPVMTTASDGRIALAYQSWDRTGKARIGAFVLKDGKWLDTGTLEAPADEKGNTWYPAVTAGPADELAYAYDIYQDGDYDVRVVLAHKEREPNRPIATSARFEARPSVCYDSQGRLWVAYEEGQEMWGKDYGAVEKKPGNPLYSSRSVRVVCLENGKLLAPVAQLPTSDEAPPHYPYDGQAGPKFEKRVRYAYPKVGIDGKGRVWLTYRQKFGTRHSTTPGSYWVTFARRLDGDHWTEPVEVLHSDGLLDDRPVLLPHAAGGLLVIHVGDGRYSLPETVHNQLYASYIDLPGGGVEPKLEPHEPGTKGDKAKQAATEEQATVRKFRDYRIEAAGKSYQLLRGEFHRHTEISWDGGPDGSLEDMFRYAIDAAGMERIGNGDHDNGAGREYSWWLVQKLTDAYHSPGHFTPMFSYERSVPYPHGHRNCVFAQRGIRTLPRLGETDVEKRVAGIHADDTKMLYRYLHEMNGICAVHTSATGMGTDWRDNDPAVEPLVEIYQGDRMSYEYEEAPRAGYDPKDKKEPANIAGWFPKGFINLALQKGYRLGFESSSDHWSTHISYAVVLAERPDRESILDAMKRRHVYGATDAIVLDVRSGTHLMGDEFKSADVPALKIHIVGTKGLDKVQILRDSEVVETLKPGKSEYEGTWTDPKPVAGMHYYYVRVTQTDAELAWSSPMWIDYTK
jgi:hypothetical protein